MKWLAAASVLLACAAVASARCQGPDCPELRSCAKKTFPQQGSIGVISTATRISDIRWAAGPDGAVNDQYIFALTIDVDGFPGGALWRSDKHGAYDSWSDQTQKIAAALPQGNISMTGVMDILWHEKKPDRIFFQGKGRYHFVSTDYGVTYKALPTPGGTEGYAQEIRPHPRQPDWLLARVRRNECLIDRRSLSCAYDLFLSQDFAATWTNLTANSEGRVASFRDFDWGCKMDMFAGKPMPDEAIFATVYPGEKATGGGKGKGLYPGWDKDLHYAVSLDFFKTPAVKTVPCGNLFEIVAKKVFLAVPSECPVGPDGKARKTPKASVSGRTVTMYVSDADGDEFTEVCLPVNLEDDGYNMIHTHDRGAAFILADHAEPGSKGPQSDSPTSDAYAPAYNSSFYTVSLRSVYRREFIADFSRVEGIPGMFIANQVDDAAMGATKSYTDFLQTRLSLNGGGDWQPLSRPERFTNPQCNTCKAGAPDHQCRLHLHGPTSWFAPEGPRPNFYSHEASPGLVIATGNVGPHLDFKSGATCTYLSRDAGLTWEDVADYVGIYEFGNNGGLVVLAPHKAEGPTNMVQFSVDQGACWHDVVLPESILVDNIRVDPKAAGHLFLVHGQACLKSTTHPNCTFMGGSTPPGRMFAIDVRDLLGSDWRDCNAAAGSSDYETWAVPKPDTCLLGARYSMVRRRRDAGCFNTASYNGTVMQQALCNCTLADTECEFGYERNGTSCAKMPDITSTTCPTLENSGYAMSSTNLRLVHADQCTGVAAVIPDTDGKGGGAGGGGKKPHGGGGDGGHSGIKTFFLLVLVTGILVVVAGVVWTHCLPGHIKDRVLDLAAPLLGLAARGFEAVLDLVITAWDWLRAKLSGATQRSAAEAAYFEPLAEVDPEDHRSPPLFPGR
ncbi:hypothetical protein ABPG77_000041 [Micractinium sp. CCAP 211/92]